MTMITLVRDAPSSASKGKREDDRRERLHRVHDRRSSSCPSYRPDSRRSSPIRRPITSAAVTPGSGHAERDAHAVDESREQIAAELVGAEQMVPRGALQAVLDVLLGRIVRRDQRREDRQHDEPADDDEAEEAGRPAGDLLEQARAGRPCGRRARDGAAGWVPRPPSVRRRRARPGRGDRAGGRRGRRAGWRRRRARR